MVVRRRLVIRGIGWRVKSPFMCWAPWGSQFTLLMYSGGVRCDGLNVYVPWGSDDLWPYRFVYVAGGSEMGGWGGWSLGAG